MSDDQPSDRSDIPEDESETGEPQPEEAPSEYVRPRARRASWGRRHWGLLLLIAILVGPAVVFGAWAWLTLNYSYSKGDRAGYIQKISKKGWLCKTWEGELAMANLPGAMPEIFHFSVRNDSVAKLIDDHVGKRVSLTYEEHRGVPTSCFAETNYYITNVRLIDP
ncbi:MAG TPA: hypothetical protein VIF83_11505 [Gemmatimonadaceae bacterium]|jgi:hypothetical protein